MEPVLAGWLVQLCRTQAPACSCAQALEERFEALMEPALAGALGRRDGARVGQLASLLADAGRSANVERLYIAARLPALQVPPSLAWCLSEKVLYACLHSGLRHWPAVHWPAVHGVAACAVARMAHGGPTSPAPVPGNAGSAGRILMLVKVSGDAVHPQALCI